MRATLCYDRPPPHFRPTALRDAHELLVRLRPALAAPLHPHDCVAAMYQALEDGLEVSARAAAVHQHHMHAKTPDKVAQQDTSTQFGVRECLILYAAVPEAAIC